MTLLDETSKTKNAGKSPAAITDRSVDDDLAAIMEGRDDDDHEACLALLSPEDSALVAAIQEREGKRSRALLRDDEAFAARFDDTYKKMYPEDMRCHVPHFHFE